MGAGYGADRIQVEERFSGLRSSRAWRSENAMSVEPTVHVVDDDAGVRRSLERLLDAAGFRTISYESPLAFLQVARVLSAGCVVLDIRMPGMDGLELQSRLLALGVLLPV